MSSPLRRRLRTGSLWAMLLLSFSTVLIAITITPQTRAQSAPASSKPHSKLSWRLQQLATTGQSIQTNAELASSLSIAASGPGSLMRSVTGSVLSYIRVTDTSAATLAAIRQAGAQIVHVAPNYHVVTAYIASDQLVNLAGVQRVASVQEALRPRISSKGVRSPSAQAVQQASCAPGIVSEGDQQLKAADARTAFGIDGTGVTVGVLSDSYNQVSSPTNANKDIQSGDLPGTSNPCGRSTPVNVVAESSDPSESTDEGRAMLQIVHDLAPGANLSFATAFEGMFSFADNIRALQGAGANVLVDDVGYFDEPFYQDGPVSVAIQDVVDKGAMYFTAAGNDHLVDQDGHQIGSYEVSSYRPTPCPTIQANTSALDCHAFKPAGGDPTFGITIQAGGGFTMLFQWAQPWFGVETNLDIYLIDQNGNVLARSNDENNGANGTQTPSEILSYTNRTNKTQTIQVAIVRVSGPAVPALKFVMASASGVVATEYNSANSTDTFGPTVVGHAMASSALSIAAIPFNDQDAPEDYSSQGPATVYFGPATNATAAGSMPAPETRQKPDVAATDGTRNSFFGNQSGSVFRFFGTSAAAPHAAAVAALMRQQANQQGIALNQVRTETILESTADAMAQGTPPSVGAGRIDAVNALYAMVQTTPQTPVQFLPLVTK